MPKKHKKTCNGFSHRSSSMKPNFYKMKRKNSMLGLSMLVLFAGCTNEYIDVKTLPRPDCTMETCISKEFDKNPVKLLVIPDSPSNPAEFNLILDQYSYRYPDSLTIKESELIPGDLLNGLEIVGNINDFNNWDRFGLPIKKLEDGFEFSNERYRNRSDAVYYVSANRQVFTGNSIQMIKELKSGMPDFYYRYVIFRHGLLSEYGLPDDRVIDIDRIRKSNFNRSSTQYFNLFVDKNFPASTRIDDSVVEDICERMDIPLPDRKIFAFLHDDANSTRLFTNFFFLTGCDTLEKDLMINTVIMNGIHTNGLNLENIKHETFHLLWNTSVGSPGAQSFLNEGIQEYYQQLLDSSRIERNIEVLKRHGDFDISNLIISGDVQDFWGGPAENNWPVAYNISGLFVKYLIDNWGLERFKAFYTMHDREEAYSRVYNKTPGEIKDEFYRDLI